jgi:hypothetical protein
VCRWRTRRPRPAPAPCPTCGAALVGGELPFEELYGEMQNLAAVLSAWSGDPAPLAALLPDLARASSPTWTRPSCAPTTRAGARRRCSG